jgi:hypothetical protein
MKILNKRISIVVNYDIFRLLGITTFVLFIVEFPKCYILVRFALTFSIPSIFYGIFLIFRFIDAKRTI